MICFQNQPCMAWLNSFQAVLPGLCNQTTELYCSKVRLGEWVSLVLSKTNYTRQSSRLGNHQLKGRRDGLDWIGGFVTWTLFERGPGTIYFIFQDDLGRNDIHFFICPKLMSKFLKWVAKFAIRRCTSYTDSQESVYLIAKKKIKIKIHKVY